MKKKITILVLTAVLFIPFIHAQNAAEENTSRELSVLRKKLSQMKREMDLLVRDVVSAVPAAGSANFDGFGSDIYIDILQNEKDVIVKADLPGMEKDKINVTLDNDKFLKISGAREIMKSEKSPGVVRQERFYGNFSKVIELPCEVTPLGINATYKDGVLEITIPKKVKGIKEETVKINVK